MQWESFDGPLQAWIQGASRGVGLGMVESLLEDDSVHVVVASARSATTNGALKELQDRHTSRLILLDVDITDEGSIKRAVDDAKELDGHFNLIVNTAGILHDAPLDLSPEKNLRDLDLARLTRSFHVNVIGHMLFIKHVHKLLPREGRSILASISARVGSIGDNGLGGWYGYRMSKAALNQGVRTASIEIRRKWKGAICVTLHPGTVDTDLSKPFQGNVPEGKLFSVEQSVEHLFTVADGLTVEDTGLFFDWAGERIPW